MLISRIIRKLYFVRLQRESLISFVLCCSQLWLLGWAYGNLYSILQIEWDRGISSSKCGNFVRTSLYTLVSNNKW